MQHGCHRRTIKTRIVQVAIDDSDSGITKPPAPVDESGGEDAGQEGRCRVGKLSGAHRIGDGTHRSIKGCEGAQQRAGRRVQGDGTHAVDTNGEPLMGLRRGQFEEGERHGRVIRDPKR